MDLKNGGITAAAAFILSFVIGLLSQSTMPYLIIWPLVFAAVFFVLFNAVKFLFGQFLPELLDDGDSGLNSSLFPGSVVNIAEGDNTNPDDDFSSDAAQDTGDTFSLQAADNAARPDDSEKGIGDISTLSEVIARNKSVYKETSASSGGIDQNMENGYTLLGESDNFSQPESLFETGASKAAVNPSVRTRARSGSSARSSGTDDTLPDLDSMAGVFTNITTEEEPETGDHSGPSSSRKSANKDKTLEGDFSPKDYAKGIQTVLKKDKEE